MQSTEQISIIGFHEGMDEGLEELSDEFHKKFVSRILVNAAKLYGEKIDKDSLDMFLQDLDDSLRAHMTYGVWLNQGIVDIVDKYRVKDGSVSVSRCLQDKP